MNNKAGIFISPYCQIRETNGNMKLIALRNRKPKPAGK